MSSIAPLLSHPISIGLLGLPMDEFEHYAADSLSIQVRIAAFANRAFATLKNPDSLFRKFG